MATILTRFHTVKVVNLHKKLWSVEIYREEEMVFRACLTSDDGKEARELADQEVTKLEIHLQERADTEDE